ncbi:Ribose-5-phosphate isomerase B [Anaerococcus prevotii]|uniref:Sugar-phosphate isomerase, RpiB/LacA/LacB family n=1 Tax=Anaerococcus prevotii (strain ATCC 9321 / DSM 20548 / JCM 6508 / NCTC 11806 / PC1) TaxID=525919 RepID=C7RHN9_ANAPD|nr:ribose 5-phosphate isomerase B [Anaerococcus prevotii]ACV29000.1 sugar-phosphate isomerase, RpiB/LacA/LacB family [Anaerococcus prevotii DSM 20548]SUU94673.1 Ribose-5-phosphate isomerase B [Anaerococcus prevotii]
MKYVIGNDHGGLDLEEVVKDELEKLGHEVYHVGAYDSESVDYSDYAKKACTEVIEGRADFAILICGTGLGMSISANKIQGIRAACVSEAYSARMSRAHNNANTLCMGARVIGSETCRMIVDEFVNTKFEGGRHQRRVDKIMDIEKSNKA